MSHFTLQDIDETFDSYSQLIDLYHQNKDKKFSIITISFEKWFAANMSAALGGILDKLEERLNTIEIGNVPDKTRAIIQKNGFLSHFGYSKLDDNYNTTMQYLKLKTTDTRYFEKYVFHELLNRPELPVMSMALKKKMTESIYEIFVNAQMHSKTQFIYTCGQYFPIKKQIKFTITDTGIGFKRNVNLCFNSDLSSIQAIKWATTDGHTTKKGVSGGIGLAILKEFITMNKGKIQIISDDGFYQYHDDQVKTKLFDLPFPGTIINLEFRTDDNCSYALINETNQNDIF